MTNSKRLYVPDPLGRLGQGHWVEQRGPFGLLRKTRTGLC